MAELFTSPFFGVGLSILTYWIGTRIHRRLKLAIFNPLLIAGFLTMGVLLLLRIPYADYNQGGSLITLLLSPATACLAVSIYHKIQLLKSSWLPVVVGCAVGSLTSMGSILLLCRLFRLEEAVTASLLPKSVTTAIAVGVAEAHGGIPSLTVVAVAITGILGSIIAPLFIRLLRVKNPLAAGLAIGACSHAMGTSKALELGETEGAASGLAIGVCGLMTVLFTMFLSL